MGMQVSDSFTQKGRRIDDTKEGWIAENRTTDSYFICKTQSNNLGDITAYLDRVFGERLVCSAKDLDFRRTIA